MPEITAILDAQHEVWVKNHANWQREETRLFGGYPMLDELERFTNETDGSYTSRTRQSPLLNFGRIHAGILIGHLNEVAPTPNYGTLGEVRERKSIPRGQETPAERFHFNANGVGSNGLPFPALASGIQVRSLATGFRWTMVEMPTRSTTKGNSITDDTPITEEDVTNGHRPFIVEYSPRSVPMWETTDGRLDWAVIRVRHRPAGLWTSASADRGFYLLVREGVTALGDEFAGGGWWLYDPAKVLLSTGSWARTNGEIPLTQFMAEESEGTEEHPAVATMPLMELNQLASGLMNRISERNWNARNAAKSQKHVLGAEPTGFNAMVEHALAGSYYIPVAGSATPDGKWLIPTIYDGASGAVESSVYAEIIRSTIEEAHEIMVRQVTSTPESSGKSKQAGFNEATSPLLSQLAVRRESWENTVIPWVEMRAGAAQPSGFVEWPMEFDLTPLIQKLDRAFERMIKIGARSPKLEARMIEIAATDEGVWPTKEAEAVEVRDELEQSLSLVQRATQAGIFDTFARSGIAEGAASLAMLEPGDAAKLTQLGDGGSADATTPIPNADGTFPPDGTPAPNVGETGTALGRTQGDAQTTQARVAAGPAPDNNASAIAALNDKLDALPAKIEDAFVKALLRLKDQLQQPPPAPPQQPLIVFPPDRPQIGKSVTVTTPQGQNWTVDVKPVDTPPPTT